MDAIPHYKPPHTGISVSLYFCGAGTWAWAFRLLFAKLCPALLFCALSAWVHWLYLSPGTLMVVVHSSLDPALAWSSYFLSGAISTDWTGFFRSLLQTCVRKWQAVFFHYFLYTAWYREQVVTVLWFIYWWYNRLLHFTFAVVFWLGSKPSAWFKLIPIVSSQILHTYTNTHSHTHCYMFRIILIIINIL